MPTLLPTELTGAHLRAQAARFLRLATVAIAAQIAGLGTGHLDRTTLTAAAIGAVETIYRSLAPAIPWSAIVKQLDIRPAAQAPTAVPDPATPPVPPTDGPASGQ